MSVQSLTESEVFSPCRIEHQDVFMYDESDIKDDSNSLCGRDGAESPTYLDISSNKLSSYPKHVEPDPTTLLSWTQKHPINWTQTEVLDWIYFVGDTVQMDQTTLRGEEFQNISGEQMCQMSADEFVSRDAINGMCFYEMFASMHKNAHFLAPPRGEFTSYYDQYCPLNTRVKIEPSYDIDIDEIQKTSKLLDSVICSNGKEMQVRLGEHWYPIDVAEIKEIEDIANVQSDANWMQDCWHGSSDSESTSDSSDMMDSTSLRTSDFPSRCCSTSSDVFSDDNAITSFPKSKKLKKPIANRRRQCHSDGHEKTQNRGRKPGQISKGNHLWEFIRDLLKDPKLNPQFLRWEEKESGVFRFVQSEGVAQLWGQKKNNPGMTYEKLSRAMRYYYKRGILDRVDGRRLVYKFGANSHGWK